ncbi:MAG TPA: alanine dehydrogenase [Tenuifilaceae bacterium]|jgi:alanine dehydrogenase|nr:alanine dehydrogenase [Bacteroidales bacterium]MDI9517166.1 alanine dehydrogenase [Bacteroidota bacterium]NLH57726.1 alanine dehydrogenase [Rikenellaceae bacterium]OQC65152.1 MAG: Alanine dehydrogenase 2 [Bacteroidetes bacterium ADurb.Bin008]HNV80639.1 alanine dehydrogenase [Tenuifilaceae bacterium]
MGRLSSSTKFPYAKGLLPQEEKLEIGKQTQRLVIGIPAEADKTESRIPLTPEAVEILVNQGHQIIIEKDAGKKANYTDHQYSEKGGEIVQTAGEVYKSQIVLKIAPLLPGEIEMLTDNQVVISSLHLTDSVGKNLRDMMKKKATALAFESIRDQDGAYPVVRAMSSIAGSTSILVAAEYLSNVNKGKGVMLGGISGITPTEVVILGASTAGEFAARAALGLGASVKIFDDSIKRLMELQDILGQRLYTSIFHQQVLERVLKTADVVIGTILPEETKGPIVISEDQVKLMKRGSVIVDLSIDRGGCFETSEVRNHDDPAFEKHGVIHYCVPNITARVARTSSIAISNVFAPLLSEIGDAGGIKQYLKEDAGLRHGVYIYNGILTNSYLGSLYGIPSRDINLLMAAF